MNPQSDINTYITAQLHAGLSADEVAGQLRGAGWTDQQVVAVFADYQSQVSPALTPAAAPTEPVAETQFAGNINDPAVQPEQQATPAQLPPPIKRGRLKTGWLLLKQSLSVIKSNPGLSRYMAMTILWSLGLFAALIALLIVDSSNAQLLSTPYADIDGSTGYTVTFLGIVVGITYTFLTTFVTYFYGAALSSHVLAIFRGNQTHYAQHIARAKTRIAAIAIYAAIATTVGYLLRLLEERFRIVGWIISRLLGALWALATSFVLPIIADGEETGVQSIKHSVGLFKKTWGETIVSRVSLTGLIVLLYILIGIPVTIVITIFMTITFGVVGFLIAFALFFIGAILIGILGSFAAGILNVSLYYYAQYGTIPPAFSPELLASVFVAKKSKKKK